MSADHRAGAENALALGEAATFTAQLPGWAVPGIEYARGQLLATLDLADAMRDLARHQADANAIALAGLGPDARITFLSKQEEHRG